MDETKERESAYSGERAEIATVGSPAEETKTAAPSEAEDGAASSQTTHKTAATEASRDAGTAAATQKTAGGGSPVGLSVLNPMAGSAAPAGAGRAGYSPAADFLEYLKRTKFVWVGLAGAAIVFMVVVTMMKSAAERARIAREKRHEEAAATVTPENLIARCGAAAEDVTKQMFPVVMRTMSYQPRENEKVVFEFSRTAEAKSDWVFLSMRDESGAKSYNTPEEKIAALPCLDSRK